MHIQAIYLFICMCMARGIVGRKVTLEYSTHARHLNGKDISGKNEMQPEAKLTLDITSKHKLCDGAHGIHTQFY